ncbi:biotin--protein ligase isoform X1 [Stigmatopora nigra]
MLTDKTQDQRLPCHRSPYLQYFGWCKRNVPLQFCAKMIEQGSDTDPEDYVLAKCSHMESHGLSLHLSNCHECLELENSTIVSVKYSSAKNTSSTPDDYLESVHETFDDSGHDVKSFACKSFGFDNKPPNVLVYTNGKNERFQAVHQILAQCLNTEKYIIYCLQPQQVLSEPWMENTRLLVLAEENVLTPQLHTRFMNYLRQGGKIFGLASSLCPEGISLETKDQQPGQRHSLSFSCKAGTKLKLNVFTSGKVFVKDLSVPVNMDLWGKLKDYPQQKDMVIISITNGERGGQAVLSQINLETCPDVQNLTTEVSCGFEVDSPNYQVLAEILTSLGLSCQQSHAPAPHPVYLLATSQETKSEFLQWLRTLINDDAFVLTSKASLRMKCTTGLHDEAFFHDHYVSLITDSTERPKWDHFCLDTYCDNLTSGLLGHTLLYAEVVSSTMDLVEGLNLHLPENVGLIVIAAQQSQGRGRGKNAWLSPLGCAMFTVCARVKLSSRLGRKISFLQHLAALAVVEAVRTLPGYEDIELRLKWPNDIYYSNIMKLGGVLVTSTLMGSTFHLLIGCGVNVGNSNPTMCINDLIQQYNIQQNCNLPPISCSQFIARSVSCLEALIDCFQNGGSEKILPLYYKRWLHSGSVVHLWSEDGPEAEILGLDSNGFLQVNSIKEGVVSVEPDGNSFDMMKNLVVMKQH